MTTTTMTLVEFLTARLDEDEQVARAASHQKVAGPFHGNWLADSALLMANGALERVDREHIARHDPARVLREVEAKRAIVARHPEFGDGTCRDCCEPYPCPTVRILAAVYSEHPDYRADWA